MQAVKGRRQEYADTTRQALLDSATELFQSRGYAAVSVEDIVRRARVTRGALYHHFKNKQDLFEAVIEELEAKVAERTAELREALDGLQAEMRRREQAEAALRQAQKMEAVGQLTGGLAHDFNNLLQGIAGSLDMARRRAGEGQTADVLRYLGPARQAVDRAAGLTRRLLAFARRQRLEPKPVDPDELLEQMRVMFRRIRGC